MADGFSKFRKGIKLDPQATTPSNPEEGDIFRSDGSVLAKGVWEYRDGSWQTLGGSGQGGINYLEGDNTDFENGVGDWTEYADAAGTEPVDGTGGSATNHSFAQTGSTPLRGTASGLMTYATASSAQGEGVSCAFTIDEADKTQKLTISFDYDGSNSNYNDGDIRVFVYDVTNSNLIRVNGEDVKAGKGTHYAQFQTAPDSTSYRLILHIATSTVGLTQFKLDNIKVGPSTSSVGTQNEVVAEGAGNGGGAITANVTDIDFTETRDTSDSFDGTIFTAPESGDYDFNGFIRFTAGVSAAIYNYIDGVQDKRVGTAGASSSSHEINGSVYLEKGQQLSFRSNVGATLNNVTTDHHIHIQKIGTSSEAATIGGGREVVVEGAGNGGTSITANVTNIDWTETRDTTASWNGTQFTAPETGEYLISGQTFYTTATGAHSIYFYIDGTQDKLICSRSSASLREFSTSIRLVKDEVLSIRADASVTLSNDANLHYINIQKLNSGKTALETETVAARYTSNNGQAITGTSGVIAYEDIDFDTHNAYNTSTGVYTVPISGYYSVSASLGSISKTLGTTGAFFVAIYIDTTQKKDALVRGTGGTTTWSTEVNDIVYLEKDQELSIEAGITGASSANSNSYRNVLSIARIK
jgi:hypothetical protein